MARVRAERRAAREAERAARVAAARERNEQRQRREQRVAEVRRRLRLTARPGLVAHARRRRARVLAFFVVLINALAWMITPTVAARGFVAVITILVLPMLAVLIVGRSR